MKLKPCPFCGSADLEFAQPAPIPDVADWIMCHTCGAFGPSSFGDRAQTAELWNQREGIADVVH